MTRLVQAASSVLAVMFLAGCASSVRLTEPAPVAVRSTAEAAPTPVADAAQPPGGTANPVASVDITQKDVAASFADLSRWVYFDFDSFSIAPDFKPVIEGHARRLVGDPAGRLLIAGHADERGSREYNLALGQKRADAVARSIVLLGGDASRIETVSFGEERPKAQGRDEEAWALNRRAELQKQ